MLYHILATQGRCPQHWHNMFIMKKKHFLLGALLSFAISFQQLHAQNVAINATGAAPAASAMLDVSSTTMGSLIPRMTSAQRTAIAAPATGLEVYDTST